MSIKFRDSEKIYDVEVTVPVWRTVVQLSGEELPTEPSDFDVINDEDIIVDYFEGYNVVYDSGDGYIQFTNDNNVYYNYLIIDENNYVVGTYITTELKEDEFLYQSGQGKEYKEFSIEIYNDDNFPLYKIVDEELVETSDEERENAKNERVKNEFKIVMENKIAELSAICNQVIYEGTDVTLSTGTKHFSFALTDQNNITSLFTSAVLTKIDGIPYHADDDICELYTYMDIVRLNKAMQEFILYNTTYFNMLKAMVSTLTTTDEVNAITYGTELNEEYFAKMNDILTQSQIMFANTLAAYGIDVESISL